MLDVVSAKAAGPAYARRWDTDRTAWMRDQIAADSAGDVSPDVPGRCVCPR